jgi:hypothetical protein
MRIRNRQKYYLFLISKFRRVLNVVCFLLGNSPASEFYMPTFHITRLLRWNGQSVPKRRHIKFRCWGFAMKKAYNRNFMVFADSVKSSETLLC